MSMSTAYHLLGKSMQKQVLTDNEVKTIIGVIRKDERKRISNYLNRRIEDFLNCEKADSCAEHGFVLQGILDDIERGQR